MSEHHHILDFISGMWKVTTHPKFLMAQEVLSVIFPCELMFGISSVLSFNCRKDDLEVGLMLLSQAKKDGLAPNLVMCRCLIGKIIVFAIGFYVCHMHQWNWKVLGLPEDMALVLFYFSLNELFILVSFVC